MTKTQEQAIRVIRWYNEQGYPTHSNHFRASTIRALVKRGYIRDCDFTFRVFLTSKAAEVPGTTRRDRARSVMNVSNWNRW